jgi:hypothetical protein
MARARFAGTLLGISLSAVATISLAAAAGSYTANQHYQKDGLRFDYGETWELNDQSNADAQQLVLTEKGLDSQIMIVAPRKAVTTPKQEEQAKATVVEPGINRLLKQYEDAGVKVSRAPLKVELSSAPAEGARLQFQVDGSPGTTDIVWAIINRRLVQLFFIRPDKTSQDASACWDLIRNSLKIES